jgi:membrane protein DedA with SNARE-associated domain
VIATYLLTAFVVALVPFLPTEPVLVGLGVLAATGEASLPAIIAVAAIGCALSDHMLYAVTRLTSGGTTHLLVRGKLGRTVLAWLQRNVTRWGPPLLVAGRWLPAGGTVGALLAGLLRWKLRRFTPVSVIGSLLWSAYATMLGYIGGAITGQPIAGLLVSLAVAVLGSLAVRFLLGRRDRSATPSGTDTDRPAAAALAPALRTGPFRPGGLPISGSAVLADAGLSEAYAPAPATGTAGRAMAAVFLAVPAAAADLDLPTVPDNAAELEPLEAVPAE